MSEFRYAVAADGGVALAGSDFGADVEGREQPSAGMLLRAAREASGLHIAALAVSLKVPVKKLEALEQDRTELLPDAVFARALAASICRSLKVDPAPVLARLPQGNGAGFRQPPQRVAAPFRSPGERSASSVWAQLTRKPVMAGVALLLGAITLVFWPNLNEAALRLGVVGDTTASPNPAASSASAAPLVLELTGSGELDATRLLSAGSMSASPEDKTAARGESPSTQSTTSASPAVLAAATAIAAVPSGDGIAQVKSSAASASGIVTFTAKAQSWVEVTDAKGAVVLRRTLAPGEVVGATGALPMAAVVGRADSTVVEVRGKPVDLLRVSRDNVARFEVK